MISTLQKAVVDLFYGVNRAKKNYQRLNTSEKVLAADGAKGIKTQGDKAIETGAQWIGAKRAVVMLTDQRIKCGDWNIPLDTIKTANLLKIGSLFGQGQILKIQTNDSQYYQFGMQFNPEWVNQDVLPLAMEEAKLKVSTFSWTVRVLAVGYIVYRLLRAFDIL
jgi:hypothetical protein